MKEKYSHPPPPRLAKLAEVDKPPNPPIPTSKPLPRPTLLNLSLHDILTSHPDDHVQLNNNKSNMAMAGHGQGGGEKNELLSTPEGPLPPAPIVSEQPTSSQAMEDFKIHELLSSLAASTSQASTSQNHNLISPKNAELLIPTATKSSTISNGNLEPVPSKFATFSINSRNLDLFFRP